MKAATPRWRRRLRQWRFLAELWLRNLPPFGQRHKKRRLFFPGCSLPSSDPQLTSKVYAHLQKRDPGIGMWSACCGRPLRQFVDDEAADPFQANLLELVRADGVEEIVTACGNCLSELRTLTREEPSVRVRSLYGLLAKEDFQVDTDKLWTVHHPCPARREPDQAEAFEELVDRVGLQRTNPGRAAHPLACCLVEGKSAERKRAKLSGANLLTYCAHCTRAFQKHIRTRHVLQVLFGSEGFWRPVSKLRSFWNYLRLRRLTKPAFARLPKDAESPAARSPVGR